MRPGTPRGERPQPAMQRPATAGAGNQLSRKRQLKKKVANGVIALSSAAVFAIYAAGYARTAPAAEHPVADEPANAAGVAPTGPAPTATELPAPTPAAPLVGDRNAPPPEPGRDDGRRQRSDGGGQFAPPSAPPTATPTPSKAPAAAPATAAYRDGTYTGTGTSRHGSIEVTIVVHGGQITSAEITGCGTRYPCSRIANLPGQVIARQGAAVDHVSGATDSTTAFRAAVVAALAQARV
jgi:uncharacterized protein with FMN-binding domain